MNTLAMFSALVVMALSAVAANADASTAQTLRVCTAVNASAVEKYAATQLTTALKAMGATVTPADAPTCASKAGDGTPNLAIGPDAATTLGVPSADLGRLGMEELLLSSNWTGLAKGSWAMTGGTSNSRGTLYAVYTFLNTLGVQYYSWNYTSLPSNLPSPLPQVNMTYSPILEYRANNEWTTATHSDWSTKAFINYGSLNSSQGGGIIYASPPGFVHTSYSLFGGNTTGGGRHPPTDLFKTNNEWFWPHDDGNAYGQLCWSNSSMVDFLIKRVKMYLTQQPDANIISVSQNDNQNYCKDPAEMAIINEEGSPIGPLLRAVNTIADAIKDDFPHVAVDTLAYQYTRPAPKITKPRPNVIIRLCSIECNFAKPLTDASNLPFQTDMVNWSQISNRTYIWNYVTNFANFVMPFPNWYVLAPNIRFFISHGVKGIFEEGAYPSPGGDLDELKDYIMAQIMWNPELDEHELISSFLNSYYGAAAPYIQTYMDLMHGAIDETNFYMHESFDWTAPFLTPEAVLFSAKAFVDGRAAVSADGTLTRRVDRSKIVVYYVILLRWDEMQDFAEKESMTWPLPESTKTDAFNEFQRVYELEGISHLSEGGNDINWLKKQIFPSDQA